MNLILERCDCMYTWSHEVDEADRVRSSGKGKVPLPIGSRQSHAVFTAATGIVLRPEIHSIKWRSSRIVLSIIYSCDRRRKRCGLIVKLNEMSEFHPVPGSSRRRSCPSAETATRQAARGDYYVHSIFGILATLSLLKLAI